MECNIPSLNTITGGTNVTVDATDPVNPIVNVPTIGGQVDSVVAGTNVTVDATDPANPIVSADAVPVIAVDFGTFIQGTPTDAEKILTIVASTAFTLPAGLTGTEAYAEVVSTAAATFTVTKNGGEYEINGNVTLLKDCSTVSNCLLTRKMPPLP